MDNPYRYSTKEWDEKSGLYYFGARYYSPEIGRWTQRDPAGTVDGLNLYAYVGNQPVSRTDPVGRFGWEVHFTLTRQWAGNARGTNAEGHCVRLGWMAPTRIALADIGTDVSLSGDVRYHLDNPCQPGDDRERVAELQMRSAIYEAQQGHCAEAYTALGRALHATQDRHAHGKTCWPYDDKGNRLPSVASLK